MLQTEIRKQSRKSAPDVDGWVAQARKLYADIEKSRQSAQEIVKQHEAGKAFQSRSTAASAKVDLLNGEITFNTALALTLEKARIIDSKVESAREALSQDLLDQSIRLLEETEIQISEEGVLGKSHVATILQTRVTNLQDAIIEKIHQRWKSIVNVDRKSGHVLIEPGTQSTKEQSLISPVPLSDM